MNAKSNEQKKQLNYLVPIIIHQRLAEIANEKAINNNSALCLAITEYHRQVCKPSETKPA